MVMRQQNTSADYYRNHEIFYIQHPDHKSREISLIVIIIITKKKTEEENEDGTNREISHGVEEIRDLVLRIVLI